MGVLEERAAVLEVEHLDVARGGPVQELVPTGQPAVRVEPLHDERELLGRVSLRNEGRRAREVKEARGQRTARGGR